MNTIASLHRLHFRPATSRFCSPRLVSTFAGNLMMSLSIGSLAFGQASSDSQTSRPVQLAGETLGGSTVFAKSAKVDELTEAAERRQQIEEFHNAKMAMVEEMAQVRAQAARNGAKGQREAVELWQKENAARIQTFQQQAMAIASTRPEVEPAPLVQMDLPASVSAEVKALLNQRTRIYNLEVAAGERLQEFPDQADAILKDWREQRDQGLATMRQLAQSVSDKAGQEPMLIAPQIEISVGASPEVRALLTERNALLGELAKAQAEHPLQKDQTHEDWMMNWYQTQSDRLQNLQQKAEQAAEKINN